MDIIYVSRVCSDKTFKKIFNYKNGKVGQQVQKYHKLIIDGFINNGVKITAVSKLQYNDKNTDINNFEIENNVKYNYIKEYRIPIIKYILFYLSAYRLIKKNVKNKEESIIICDGLNIILSLAAKNVSKNIKCRNAVIVTDVPGIIMTDSKPTFFNQCLSNFNIRLINSFDKFIILTEKMNKIINKNNKPYVVIEGQVDIKMNNKNICYKKLFNVKKIFLYAGIISRNNGVDKLVQAFSELQLLNAELHLYGDGEYEETLKIICNNNQSIKFFGIKENSFIIEKEIEASVLINPRPTSEEFTKYSFPSKIMEYMVSGTPLMTTKLAGMPLEYYDIVFLIEDESIEGFKKQISYLNNIANEELQILGLKAKEFVLKNKNNIIQSKKISDFLNIN